VSGSRLVLVATDQRFASAVQSHVKKTLSQRVFPCRFGRVLNLLGPDTDGVLLLGAVSPHDTEPIRRLVQEIRLREWPPAVIVLAGEQAGPELAALDPHVQARLRWPAQADRLVALLREGQLPVQGFPGTQEQTLEEIFRHRLLAQTPALACLAPRLALAAAHDVPVLLIGETGTGKTFLARLIHECSPQPQQRFLTVACGALSPHLIQSEFFGHQAGAFTGADRSKAGKFAAASHGTLLLDEIDTLSLKQQAALLRVLETGEYEPVGGHETLVSTARLIIASNVDLEGAVRRGTFRQDLYYRLNMMAFHLPPLRERLGDIAPLTRGLVARFTFKFRKDLFAVHPDVVAALESFPWPGNVRQLENAIQHAVLLSTGPELLPGHLPPPIQEHFALCRSAGVVSEEDLAQDPELRERHLIQQVLARHDFSRAQAAHALGISRVTLYKKMRKYGLTGRPQGD
jgi:transcriptional regulator with PAS, ATPase and Fis domain